VAFYLDSIPPSEPERFITRNSGFVIAAAEIDVDDNKKIIRLKPGIINGAQSRGEIECWVHEVYGDDYDPVEEPPFYVRAEIIVDPDADELVETAIARNTATPVKSISQAGARTAFLLSGHTPCPIDPATLELQPRRKRSSS
jgi:hypothetical protein